ncbi:MAG: BlaI/MecI/CopY family transcriptional regulator [Pirellulales bacterium]
MSSMAQKQPPPLSRRERQIMDIIYERGPSSAGEIRACMADAPSYSTVRTLLRVLKDKGHVQQKSDGPRYVYSPTVSPQKAKRWALERLVATFFAGSAEAAMATLINMHSARLSRAELDRLQALIRTAKEKEGDKKQAT